MNKQFHPTFYLADEYLFMLGLKLVHINKSDHVNTRQISLTDSNRYKNLDDL